MAGRPSKPLASALSLALAFVLGIGAYAVVKDRLDKNHDDEVTEAVRLTREISLVSLGIQDIKPKREAIGILGVDLPGTSKTVFLRYSFDAKLGLDGSKVNISKIGENAFLISVPEFIFIGHQNEDFKVVAEDGGVLSWATKDIKKEEMITQILNSDKGQQAYLRKYDDLLKSQTEAFYNSLIHSIDASIKTTFEFK